MTFRFDSAPDLNRNVMDYRTGSAPAPPLGPGGGHAVGGVRLARPRPGVPGHSSVRRPSPHRVRPDRRRRPAGHDATELRRGAEPLVTAPALGSEHAGGFHGFPPPGPPLLLRPR